MTLRTFSAALATLGLLTFTGCKDFYNVNVDPLHPSVATADQLLPGTQVAMATYLGFSLQGLGQGTSTLVGQLNSGRGVGSFQQSGASFSNQWSGLYNDMLANNEIIIKQAREKGQLGYLGVAQLQKAYVFSIMVDMWGSIPYSQALQGIENRTPPRFDSDRDIYLGNPSQNIQSLFSLIDDGIANVTAGPAPAIGADIIYGGKTELWAAFGRTLKLKLYNQIRNVPAGELGGVNIGAEVNTLLTQQLLKPLMQADFEVPYGASFQPENRNISYLSNYVNIGREDFINQDFVGAMAKRNDPRFNFYFYTQAKGTGAVDFDTTVTLFGKPYYFATVKLGSTGVLASAAAANLITLPGLYPSGGRYDSGGGSGNSLGANFTYAKGLVAQRLLTTFNRYFIEAELQLMVLNNPAAAKAAYLQGVRAAFLKVDAIGKAEGSSPITSTATTLPIPSVNPDVPSLGSTYLTQAERRYDLTTTQDQKLAIIMYEKYVASFGFGEDIYTDYRRTGKPFVKLPGDVPGTVASGAFPRRLFYNIQELTANSNAPQQPAPTSRIFWDR